MPIPIDLAILITCAESSDEVYSIITTAASSLFHADRASVALYDPMDQSVKIHLIVGEPISLDQGKQIPMHAMMLRHAIESRLPYAWSPNAEDLEVDSKLLLQAGMKSAVNVPILYSNRVIGTLNIAHRNANALSESEIKLAEKIAHLMGATIHRLTLLEENLRDKCRLENYAKQLELLNEISRNFTKCASLQEVFQIVRTGIRRVLPIDRSSIVRLNPDGKTVTVEAVDGEAIIPEGTTLPLEGTALELAFRTGEVVVNSVFKNSGYREHATLVKAGLCSGVSLPIKIRGKVCYSLNLASREMIGAADNIVLLEAITSMMQDVLNRIHIQEERKEESRASEARLRAIIQSLPVGVALFSVEGNLTYASERFASILQFSSERELEKNWEKLIDFPTEENGLDRSILTQQWLSYRRTIKPDSQNQLLQMQVRIDSEDHGIQFAPIWESGHLNGFVATIASLTRNRREAEVLRLAQKMKSVGVIAGGLAHDFNNLLGIALAHLSILLKSRGDISRFEEDFGQMKRALERAALLSRQLLSYASERAENQSTFDVNQELIECMRLLSVSLPKNVVLSSELSPQIPLVEFDPAKLQQLITNLIINAAESLSQQQGRVVIKTGVETILSAKYSETIPQHLVLAGSYVSISCEDNGHGVPEEIRHRIFEPFFTTRHEGHGLGLSSCVEIVREARGELLVRSNPRGGATFSVLIPTSVSLTQMEGAQLEGECSTDSGTILIIEDESPLRQVIGRICQNLGFNTILAVDGLHGIEEARLNSNKITMILIDHSMPKMNGITASGQLREICPEARIVLMTGYSMPLESLRAQIDEILLKPFGMQELEKILRTLSSRE